MAKLDQSARTNIHGKWMRWSSVARIKVTREEGEVFGIHLYSVVKERSSEAWEETALTELGFPPASRSDTLSTTSEESGEDDGEDPTADLEPIIVTKGWLERPLLGSGWWGRGPPIQVHHNYRSRDLVDGGGLCSPGRRRPSKRHLPLFGRRR